MPDGKKVKNVESDNHLQSKSKVTNDWLLHYRGRN